MRPFILALLAFVLFPACASTRDASGTEPNGSPASLATAGDFVDYLGRRGYVLRPAGVTVPFVLDRPGQAYNVAGGGQLVVYEFDSAEAAAEGVNAFRLDAMGGGGAAAVYRHGPLLVASSGGRAALQLTLTQALGPPVY